MNRRQVWLASAIGIAAATVSVAAARSVAGEPPVDILVYKSPTCGCCSKWIDHLKANGFNVTATDVPDMAAVHRQNGVPDPLISCHTALVDSYVIEGHVPADVIQRLLKEKPRVHGLTIPGMPASAPGMDAKPPVPYEVLTFQRDGKTAVYERR